MKNKACAACRNAERKTDADYYIEGRTSENRPYRAYLCADHLADAESNWLTVKAARPMSQEAWKHETRRLWDSYSNERKANGYTKKADRLHKAFCRAQDRAGLNA